MHNVCNPEKKWRALSEARYSHKLNSLQCVANNSSSLIKKCNEPDQQRDELRSDASSNSGPTHIKSHTPEREPFFIFPLAAHTCREMPLKQRFKSLTGSDPVSADVTGFPKVPTVADNLRGVESAGKSELPPRVRTNEFRLPLRHAEESAPSSPRPRALRRPPRPSRRH